MVRSRINQKLVKQTERNLILIVLGVVVAAIIFLVFGINLLVKFSLFIEKKSDTKAGQSVSSNSFIISPSLDPVVTSTNSASLDITGSSENGTYIKLYINGEMIKKADIHSDKSFVVRDVKLITGENDIKAKAFDSTNRESDFSETVFITYSNKAPDLSLNSPSDGQTYHKDNNPLRVNGKTNPNVRVTINGFWAIVDDQGNYSYNLPLKDGDNEVKVEATDLSGNKTQRDIHINYSE